MSDQTVVNIWGADADVRFSTAAKPAPKYLTRAQACRWERITQARALYDGDHYRYFIEQKRSQFPVLTLDNDGEERKVYVKYNLLARISNTSADLLFGKEPLIRVDDDVTQSKLGEFSERTDLHALLVEMEIECSFAGEAILQASIYDDHVYLELVPAEQIHPVGAMMPDRQYAEYVRYAEVDAGTDSHPITVILKTTYRAGEIERHCYQDNVDPRNEVALSEWPEFKTKTPATIERTGIPYNTIIWFPNLMVGGRVRSDYATLLDLQDALNNKNSECARILHIHSRPKIRAPRSAADERGGLRAASEVLYSDGPDDWGYVTWDGQLEAAFKDRDFYVDAMCVMSETSPALLGLDRGGAVESARAMRLRATPSIAKAERKATLRRPTLKWAMFVVQALEQTITGNRYNVRPVAIEMRDGLPIDESEQATTISTYRSADAMSIERAVELQISDPPARDREIARIKKAKAEAVPSIVLGEPRETSPAPSTEDDE